MNARRNWLVLALAAAPLGSTLAQTAMRQARIGWLSQVAPPPAGTRQPWESIFINRLREHGWIEGRNLKIDIRYASGRAEALQGLAAELVALRCDLLVAGGTTAIRALRDATATIPIVMAGGGDPVGSGLVASLSRPGGNITGVSLTGQELIPKALSLLHEAVPRARRIDLLGNAANPANPFFAQVFAQAARERGLDGRLVEARSAYEMDAVIASARVDALQVLADPLLSGNARRFADTAIGRRLPLATTTGRYTVEAGFLLSYSTAQDDIWRLSADFADRILRGARPAEMPIEQPSRYELFVNQKTARAIGLTIPQPLLLRADEVIG